jgi:hypothetical protein
VKTILVIFGYWKTIETIRICARIPCRCRKPVDARIDRLFGIFLPSHHLSRQATGEVENLIRRIDFLSFNKNM